MKIAFLFSSFESLGIEALSASLKRAGHETALFFDPRLFDDNFYYNKLLSRTFDERNEIVRRLVRWEPDLVAISVLSDTNPWAMDMARRIKKVYPVPIVVGGIHPTSVPDVVIKNANIDYVVQGEGDEAIVELADCIEAGADCDGLANLWSRQGRDGALAGNHPRPFISDLDSLPFADKSLYDGTFIKDLDIYSIAASRGCPYRCTYCNAALMKEIYCDEKGAYWRTRSVDSVVEELKQAARERHIGVVIFFDELFGADIRWLREFAPRYKREIGKPFLISAHPGHATEEYVALLKEAGCIKADLGVQSTDPAIRKDVLRRHETNDQIANAIDNFMRAGIFLHVENILNLPGQNEENLKEMVRFYNIHRPRGIKIFGLRIFPRTPIEKIALERGLIAKEYVERIALAETAESGYEGGTMRDSKLFKFQTLFAVMLFLPPRWVDTILEKRLYRFFPKSPRYGTSLSRLLNAQTWEEDAFKRTYAMRYKYYFLKHLKKYF